MVKYTNNYKSRLLWFNFQIALEGLRVTIPSDISPHLSKLIKICINEDPGKRPTFDMVLPILNKMKR